MLGYKCKRKSGWQKCYRTKMTRKDRRLTPFGSCQTVPNLSQIERMKTGFVLFLIALKRGAAR